MVGRPSHGHWARQGGGLPPGQWSRVNRRPRREGGHSPSRASPTRRGAQGAQAASPQAVRTSALGGPVWPGGWISPCAWGQGEGVASRGRCGTTSRPVCGGRRVGATLGQGTLRTGCPHPEASGVPRAPGPAIRVTHPVRDRASYRLVLPQDGLTGQGATVPQDPLRDPSSSSSSGSQGAAPPPCL